MAQVVGSHPVTFLAQSYYVHAFSDILKHKFLAQTQNFNDRTRFIQKRTRVVLWSFLATWKTLEQYLKCLVDRYEQFAMRCKIFCKDVVRYRRRLGLLRDCDSWLVIYWGFIAWACQCLLLLHSLVLLHICALRSSGIVVAARIH